MTSVVISQPMYFPWPGFFELVASADVYVHLDDVQFSKGSFTNRVQIRSATGTNWLTVPLARSGSFEKISDLETSGDAWKGEHRRKLEQSLKGAPHADHALSIFDRVVSKPRLYDILTTSVEETSRVLGLSVPREWHTASELGVSGSSWSRVLGIVRALGGTRYVTAHGAANYLDHEAFEAAGVTVEYIEYSKTAWTQQGAGFTPFVTVLDLLANSGETAIHALQPSTSHWQDFIAARAASK